MGKLYDLIQEHIDRQPYGVSERQVAMRLGVTQTTLSNWREPKKLIAKKHLIAISRVTGVPYLRVLDALLDDIGYLDEREDVMGNAEHPAPIGREEAGGSVAELRPTPSTRSPRGSIAASKQPGKSRGRQLREQQDAETEAVDPPPPHDGA